MKKGQGMSMSTIVIAAIALLVLIVVLAIFGGRMGIFKRNLEDQTGGQTCPGEKATAFDGCSQFGDNYKMALGSFSNIGGGEICCIADT